MKSRKCAAVFFFATFACAAIQAQPLEVVVQSGHSAEIRDVLFSPDGCTIATAGVDNRVKLWDEISGKEFRSFQGGLTPHYSLAFSPDGNSLYAGRKPGSVSRWSIDDGSLISEFPASSGMSISLSSDGRYLASTDGEGREPTAITVWDTVSGATVGTYSWHGSEKPETPYIVEGHRRRDHEPRAVALSHDGELIASAGQEGRTALWRVGQAAPLRFYSSIDVTEDADDTFSSIREGPPNIVVAFSPDKLYLAGSERTDVLLWPVNTDGGATVLTDSENAITSLTFSDDGDFLAAGNSAGLVIIWDRSGDQPQMVAQFQAHAESVHALSFKPTENVACPDNSPASDNPLNGRVLVTSGKDGVARIWTLANNILIRSFAPKVQPLNSVTFSHDGTRLAIASSGVPHGSAKIWDLTTGYQVSVLDGHDGGVNAIAFSNDNSMLATAGTDGATMVWDAQFLSEIHRVGPPKERKKLKKVWATIFGLLAIREVDLLNLMGYSSILAALDSTKHDISEGARSLAFDDRGRYMAIGGNRDTILWDLQTGENVETKFGDSSIRDIQFTPGGEYLISVGWMANRRSVSTGDEIDRKYARRVLTDNTGALSAEIFPGREQLALGYDDGRLHVRNIETGSRRERQVVQSLLLEGGIYALQFSPDGRMLAAAGSGGSIHIYDVGAVLSPRHSFPAHSDTIHSVAFSPDGSLLASVSSDGTARLWKTDTWEEVLTFVSIGSEDYVVLSPDNHYAASTNGHYGVAFRRGNQIYPFEQFDLQLNRPDIVFARLGTVSPQLIDAYRDAHAKRLERMQIESDELLLDLPLPIVRIRDVPMRTTTADGFLSFTLEADSAQQPITALQVWVNDVPVFGSEGYELPQPQASVRHPVNLQLSEGRNKVQVSATDTLGREAIRATMVTTYQPAVETPHDLYVVAVGVSRYQNEEFNLEYASKDAEDLLGQLSRQRRFANIHSFSLLDEAATKEQIVDVRTALMKSSVDDEVVMFFAGHGVLDADLNYFFGTHDIDFTNPSERGLAFDALEGLLDGIPARRKLLLLDTCYSGEVDPGAGLADPESSTGLAERSVVMNSVRGFPPSGAAAEMTASDSFELMQRLFANLGRGSGTAVIAASGGDEFAFESEQTRNGVFTHTVLEAIGETEDTDFLGVSDLRSYVTSRVLELTGGMQRPSFRRVNLEFDYPVFSLDKPNTMQLPVVETGTFGKLLMQALEAGVEEDED